MSSSDAQRSPIHHATEDSSAEPTGPISAPAAPHARPTADQDSGPDGPDGPAGNFERGAAMAGRRPDGGEDANPPGVTTVVGGGPGGGAGAGIPGGGTDIRTGGAFNTGNPDEDRNRLFPQAPGSRHPRETDDANVGKDSDESSYGGPLDLDDPNAV